MATRSLKPLGYAIPVLLAASAAVAGPINPPAGPVAPTGKTLTQVEPRIPIGPDTTPGDADSVYRITQPGSYYLTGNLTGQAGKGCIEIDTFSTGSVTIDLGGFELVGVGGSLAGISRGASASGPFVVRNGTVRGFGGTGVHLTGSAHIENIHTLANTGDGLKVGNASVIRNCAALGNSGDGIDAGDTAVIEACTSRDNNGVGIVTLQGATITGCTVNNGNGVGIMVGVNSTIARTTVRFNDLGGMSVGSGGLVDACTIGYNTGFGIDTDFGTAIRGCTVYSNTGHGIVGSAQNHVTGNTVYANTGDGIRMGNDCTITFNHCSGNGAGAADGAGIHTLAPGNRIEANTCNGNDRGIDVDQIASIIVRNTCRGNGVNWSIVAGNTCLVVSGTSAAAISGNAGGTAPGSADPNANFTY